MHRSTLEQSSAGFPPTNPRVNNLRRLKAISKSFEDLTSETLYSKWKKARKNGAKDEDRSVRSISLISLVEEEFAIKENEGKGKNSVAAELRSEIFRPRGWTVCSGESRQRKFSSDVSPIDAEVWTTANSLDNLDDDGFTKPENEDTYDARQSRIVSEIILETSGDFVKKNRNLSDSDQSIPDRPKITRTPSDLNYTHRQDSGTRARRSSCRETGEIEFLRTAEIAPRHLEENMEQQEEVWKKRNTTSHVDSASERRKRSTRDSVIQPNRELKNNAGYIQEASFGFINDRSQPDVVDVRYALARSYVLGSQPEPSCTSINQEDSVEHRGTLARIMSVPSGKKEFNSCEEKEKDDRSVTFKEDAFHVNARLEATSSRVSVKRAQTLPRMPKRPLLSPSSKHWKENEERTRKSAKDLLDNINKSTERSEEERVDVVERAFEWIRKEVADLRSQDKDIMRMFTKIQAGIRHIKFDQTRLAESEEELSSSPDLSNVSSKTNDGSSLHRRASLL